MHICPLLMLLLGVYALIEVLVGAYDGNDELVLFAQIQSLLTAAFVVIQVILQSQ